MQKEENILTNRIKLVAKEFLEKIQDKDIQIVSHFDTDGITSAAIMIKTLKKLDKTFSVKIVKNLEEQDFISLKEKRTPKREISQNNQTVHNREEDITEYARMKYSIDNLFVDDENEKEDFNPNNYRKCNECFSIIETKHRSCPYCGSSI